MQRAKETLLRAVNKPKSPTRVVSFPAQGSCPFDPLAHTGQVVPLASQKFNLLVIGLVAYSRSTQIHQLCSLLDVPQSWVRAVHIANGP